MSVNNDFFMYRDLNDNLVMVVKGKQIAPDQSNYSNFVPIPTARNAKPLSSNVRPLISLDNEDLTGPWSIGVNTGPRENVLPVAKEATALPLPPVGNLRASEEIDGPSASVKRKIPLMRYQITPPPVQMHQPVAPPPIPEAKTNWMKRVALTVTIVALAVFLIIFFPPAAALLGGGAFLTQLGCLGVAAIAAILAYRS